MPDLAMCRGERAIINGSYICPRRQECYRYTTTPTPRRQAWALPLKDDGTCDHFIPNGPEAEDDHD